MLPGDYLAMRLTQRVTTTISGLSEMVLWDFYGSCISEKVIESYGLNRELVPEVLNTFEAGGETQPGPAEDIGLVSGIPVTYRAGD